MVYNIVKSGLKWHVFPQSGVKKEKNAAKNEKVGRKPCCSRFLSEQKLIAEVCGELGN